MALNLTYNTIEQGAAFGSECEPCTDCASTTPDPIRASLVAAGVSATDLANYDACPTGGYINLTHSGSVALVQAVRTAALANVSGTYRIGNLDAAFDSVPTGGAANQLSASSSTTPAQDRLLAGTTPYIVFIATSPTSTEMNTYKLRKGTLPYQTTILNTVNYATDVLPALLTDNSTYRPYSVLVFKKPYSVDTVDRNTAVYAQGTFGYNSAVSSAIGAGNTTILTTNNIYNRQWQALCANPSIWPGSVCTVSTTSGTASQTITGLTKKVTFTIYGTGSDNGLLDATPTVTGPAGYTIANISKVTNNSGTFTFTADVTVPAGTPDRSDVYTVTLNSTTVTVNGSNSIDAIAGALTGTDLTTYNNATTGQIVEISATGYSALASIANVARYGTAESTMPNCNTTWGGGNYITAIGTGTQGTNIGTFIPQNYYPFAFSIMMNQQPATAGAGTFEFGFIGASAGSGATTWTPKVLMGTNTTAFTANGATGNRRYFVMKGANSQTTQQSAVYAGGLPAVIGGFSAGVALNFVKNATPYTLTSVTNNYSYMLGIQCLASPTKQW